MVFQMTLGTTKKLGNGTITTVMYGIIKAVTSVPMVRNGTPMQARLNQKNNRAKYLLVNREQRYPEEMYPEQMTRGNRDHSSCPVQGCPV